MGLMSSMPRLLSCSHTSQMHAALAQRSSCVARAVGDAVPSSVMLRRDQPRPLHFQERHSNRSPRACSLSEASAARDITLSNMLPMVHACGISA